MSRILSVEQRLEIVNIYRETNSFVKTAEIFNERHPERQYKLGKSAVFKLHKRLFTTGNLIDNFRKGRKRLEEANVESVTNIMREVEQNSHVSIREIARKLKHSPRNVIRILKANNYKPYKFQKHQRLSPVSYEARNSFCCKFIAQTTSDPRFLEKVLWTDECLFTLNGAPNKQTYR